jgi:hypothetical protein
MKMLRLFTGIRFVKNARFEPCPKAIYSDSLAISNLLADE